MQKKHFYLANKIAETRKFKVRSQGGESKIPQRNREEHADFIKGQYEKVINDALGLQDMLTGPEETVADGVYLDVDVVKGLIPKSLDTKNGVQILKVSEEETDIVTIYVKKEKRDWLPDKVDKYIHEETITGRPKYEDLIAPINDILPADIKSLYEPYNTFEGLPQKTPLLFELWINKRYDYSIDVISQTLDEQNIECNIENRLQFDDVDVFLIKTTKETLDTLPTYLGYIEGIRRYHQPSILTETHETNREWNALLRDEISFIDGSLRVGILDSGVNNAHELLSPILPDDKMDSAIGVLDNIDHGDHGTGMAGLALLGDLTELAYRSGMNLNISHSLASVKIIENGHETDSDFYGSVIEEGIDKAQDMGAVIDCMAVTDEDTFNNSPTSSSAALDESIYHGGACDRLVLVSAGNIETSDVDYNNYLDSCKASAILSPSQAWNALTVGAYTEKAITSNRDQHPLAAPGGISPLSRSTYSWVNANWRVKPEIVMEGGNVTYSPAYGVSTDPDLSVITTSQDLSQPLIDFNATSAATALATNLAAKIKEANPDLSVLSVRALLVHSAEWTSEMNKLGKAEDIMPLCGYGVPNEAVATFSSEKCATFVFENEIVPFIEGSSSNNIYNEMHYYDLPWPSELLEAMHDENVTMRITLSYYVKPAPGRGGRNNKYRYPSATLYFDIKKSTETEKEFLARCNKNDEEDNSSKSRNATKLWNVGIERRKNGTVQSDWITCTAQELAECGKIVVCPSCGWWKERKLKNVDNKIKYSLVVSIKSEQTEIYQAVETAIKNRIGITIANI
ncbi:MULTISPECIES: S8 family peptidase [Prevotella]|uniref:Subtilisin proteinase n=1 Tax=Prevotella herbatica TaxID=2801997 RepID=A0ABM7NVL1_9BACT|nr:MULTISPECIES: S8 family peptidase [Prevotella]MDN5554826.1 S8 family peptidase [Prevotella sp.]BCS84509.1 subtilisin proteinase [Prevotella herbatica]